MATKTLTTLRITNPAGEARVIAVKPSVSIALEERLGRPIWAQAFEGYTGAGARIAYEVGRDAGFIPAEVTFEEFVDADPGWEIDLVAPGYELPKSIDQDADVDQVDGEASGE